MSSGVGRQPGADRPDRLVGDDDGLARRLGRQRAPHLPNDHRGLLARLALGVGFADADDRRQAGLQRRLRLRADERVGLAMTGPALGMADDDVARAGVLEHRRGNVAGEGAAGSGEQSCAPRLRSGRRASRRPARSASPAGRRAVRRRRLPLRPPRRIARSRPSEPERPFIFQLPATSGRTPGSFMPLRELRRPGCYHRRLRLCKARRVRYESAQAPLEGRASGPATRRRIRRNARTMRNASQGVVGKSIMTIVMGLIIVSFVIWGVGDMLRGFSSTRSRRSAARITAQEYRVATIERSSNISAGSSAVDQRSRRTRWASTAGAQRLIDDAALDDEAPQARAGISDETIARSSPRTRACATSPARSTATLRPGLARHGPQRARLLRRAAQACSAAASRRAGDGHQRAQSASRRR